MTQGSCCWSTARPGSSSTRCAPKTWEVHDQIVEPFEGGYAAYILQRVERDRINAASRTEAPEPHAQGTGMAAPRCSCPEPGTGCRIEPANQLIGRCSSGAPPTRIELKRIAVGQLGKDVVDPSRCLL